MELVREREEVPEIRTNRLTSKVGQPLLKPRSVVLALAAETTPTPRAPAYPPFTDAPQGGWREASLRSSRLS